MLRKSLIVAAAVFAVGSMTGAAGAQEVTVGYQLIYNPWKVAIARGTFEQETGATIRWVKFDSGAKVINAMASGQVDIALAGSSPIAAGVSRGVDMQLFFIQEDIASAEALVVRDGSGIDPADPQTLKGKKLGVPFVSTTHFHTLVALEMWGIDPDDLTILNMQPNQIAAAWERGDIDAAFVWDPALGRIKKTGKVMITSGEITEKTGKATFDGMVVMREFAEANPEFMARFVEIMDRANEEYRSNPGAWTPDSEQVKAIVSLVGGNPDDVPTVLALYKFPTLEEQASPKWLGGGKEGNAARAIAATAAFLKDQGKLDEVQPDYSKFVTPRYVEMAMELRKK